MDLVKTVIDFILHIDVHLGELIQTYGHLTYAILFIIICLETGLVFTSFLPGDTLLFAAGAFSSLGSLNVIVLWLVLFLAAVIGDTMNFWIGYFFGQRIIHDPRIPLNAKHLQKAKEFFDKYGAKTIILARFIPFARTFIPFVAGVGKMNYKNFFYYDVIGGFLWTVVYIPAGYFFGNIPIVKENFSLVIIAIVLISITSVLIEIIKDKLKSTEN